MERDAPSRPRGIQGQDDQRLEVYKRYSRNHATSDSLDHVARDSRCIVSRDGKTIFESSDF
jgi:hypothetical protein